MTAQSEHPPDEVSPRPTCYRCFRPRSHCYCSEVPLVPNRTEMVILQHARERFHPIGTARIAALGLARVRLESGSLRDLQGRVSGLCGPGTGLLFPKPPCRDLAELGPNERPERLIVLDGTWHHAHTLFRDLPGLADLPRYGFRPPEPSRYRLRREPRADFVSTIEAIAHCLSLLEPETPGVARLLETFHGMIDRQIASRERALATSSCGRVLKHRRDQLRRRLPRALAEDFARAVVCYGEAVPARMDRERKVPVQFVALRLSSRESFEAVLPPPADTDSRYLAHAGLSERDFARATTSGVFRQRWRGFQRPDDILLAWHPGTLGPFASLLGDAHARVFLKAAYHQLGRGRGPLEQLVVEERLVLPTPSFEGRAGRRLANAEALARFLHETSQDATFDESG